MALPQPIHPATREGAVLAHRYRLLSVVGKGGTSAVWRARDEILGRDVAIKELTWTCGTNENTGRAQIVNEARAAARLKHPGAVTVHDLLTDGDGLWIVMELIEARSLQEIIERDGPLPPRRAAAIGRQVLAVLVAAHTIGIVHCDVKPSNLLVTDDDRVVLIDFGLAIDRTQGPSTRVECWACSPPYASPEQALSEPITEAVDLWALGATLYASVEGHPPYERNEPLASLVAVLAEDYAPPLNAGPLRPVIEMLLRKNSAERGPAAHAARLLECLARP